MLYYDQVTDAVDALSRSDRLREYVSDAPAFAGREDLDGTLRDIVRVVCARVAAEKALESIA